MAIVALYGLVHDAHKSLDFGKVSFIVALVTLIGSQLAPRANTGTALRNYTGRMFKRDGTPYRLHNYLIGYLAFLSGGFIVGMFIYGAWIFIKWIYSCWNLVPLSWQMGTVGLSLITAIISTPIVNHLIKKRDRLDEDIKIPGRSEPDMSERQVRIQRLIIGLAIPMLVSWFIVIFAGLPLLGRLIP